MSGFHHSCVWSGSRIIAPALVRTQGWLSLDSDGFSGFRCSHPIRSLVASRTSQGKAGYLIHLTWPAEPEPVLPRACLEGSTRGWRYVELEEPHPCKGSRCFWRCVKRCSSIMGRQCLVRRQLVRPDPEACTRVLADAEKVVDWKRSVRATCPRRSPSGRPAQGPSRHVDPLVGAVNCME